MTTTASLVETRTLPPDEWPRLAGTALETLWPKLTPQTARIVVVERDGEIIACWAFFLMPHVEGLWIAPEERGRSGVARRLQREMWAVAREYGASVVWTGAETEDIKAMIAKAGGVHVPFDSYMLPVPPEVD